MDIAFPWSIDGRGRTELADFEAHVRQMVEQVLFTAPGERVNRPTFGCALGQLLFEPNNEVLAATTQFTVQASLQQWLGDVIQVNEVAVEQEESALRVRVGYTLLRTRATRTEHFVYRG